MYWVWKLFYLSSNNNTNSSRTSVTSFGWIITRAETADLEFQAYEDTLLIFFLKHVDPYLKKKNKTKP